ncbi:glycosyltransferase family 4 protein [Pararhizobium sp.]|uniref:glycosyltransferase family 4 protein n=1 Tax=Pararhizobium sp. TaxID=1977563 RepID=UPI002717F5E4|nr:glycosyltransferase family 4 protein [Pararhizobium sp.]MDO9418357.1 glycosyltransferase family 4 protein [Pararhizobium sp.]
MKIAHLCLSCFYIDGYGYQENELVRQHVIDGHEVVVVTSTESFGADRNLTYVDPSTYMGKDGAKVIRLPYRKFLPHKIMRKLRLHPGVFRLLEDIDPDVILFHGLCGWELFAAAKYKQKHQCVKLYADSHEDQNNSARNFASKYFLHRLYYRSIITKCRKYIEKFLCVSIETMDFVEETYGIPRSQLEFYPLGGRVFDDAEYAARRERGRRSAGVTDGQTMLFQSGKMGPRKKILESLRAFTQTEGADLRLMLAGSFDERLREEAEALVAADSRISFLGWKETDDLSDLLCAADVYVQPGTQSATMQMSLCARCPVVLDHVPSHKPFVEGNGWMLDNADDLYGVFRAISECPAALEKMSAKSLKIASRLLDYRSLATRILK